MKAQYTASVLLLVVNSCVAGPFGPWQEKPSKVEKDLQCVFEASTNKVPAGVSIPSVLVLRNIGSSMIHVPMLYLPYKDTARSTVFVVAKDGTNLTEQTALASKLADKPAPNQNPPWFRNLQPNQVLKIPILVESTLAGKQNVSQGLPPGRYGLQMEIEYHVQRFSPVSLKIERFFVPPSYASGVEPRALPPEEQKRKLAEQQEKIDKDPPECIDPAMLWSGKIQSNVVTIDVMTK